MRIAALYDIHGNLPALEAVLEEIGRVEVDQIVVGGDVLPGPMPRETLQRLLSIQLPVHFIQGNGELAVQALLAAPNEDAVTYWGTVSGKPLPEVYRPNYRWTAQQVGLDYQSVMAHWPKTLRLEIDGLGAVLFCHGTPRSETEVFTRLTTEARLKPLFKNVNASVVVCGHTHMQFYRRVGETRVVNAGSVGESYGVPGAYWLLLDTEIRLQYTPYDLAQAAERIRSTGYPQAQEFVQSMLHPPQESEMLDIFTSWELT